MSKSLDKIICIFCSSVEFLLVSMINILDMKILEIDADIQSTSHYWFQFSSVMQKCFLLLFFLYYAIIFLIFSSSICNNDKDHHAPIIIRNDFCCFTRKKNVAKRKTRRFYHFLIEEPILSQNRSMVWQGYVTPLYAI